jgi:hypothetical protein
VLGAKQFSKIIGYDWGTNGFNKNYVALRMLPERYSQEGGERPPQITVALKVLHYAQRVFQSKGISQRIAYLERAYINRAFKPDLFLTKPKGMKIYYPQGAIHPHEQKKEKKKSLNTLKEKAGRFAMGVFGFFSTLRSLPTL